MSPSAVKTESLMKCDCCVLQNQLQRVFDKNKNHNGGDRPTVSPSAAYAESLINTLLYNDIVFNKIC